MKTAKQDRQGVRTFAEVMGFATDAQKDATQAKEEAEEVSEKMKPEEIFRLLTNDGKSQGLYRGDDGNLYVNGEYIQAGTFTSKAEVYINPGVEEFETVKNHILGKQTIPANRIALYDTNGSGNINITDMVAFKAAMLGNETIANWPNAVKTNITVTVDAKDIEKTVKISGTNMWGRHIEFYIGLNGGNIGRHDGNLAVNGLLSINGDITLLSDGNRSVITGLTNPVEDSDAVNKAYVDENTMPQKCAYINTAVSADTITAPFVLLDISANNTELRTLLGGANFAYLQTQYYATNPGYRLQVAWSYAINPARMAFRTEYQGTWSNWGSVSSEVEQSEVEQTTTGVLELSVGNVTYDYSFTYRIIKKANGIVEIYGTSEEIETHITKAYGSLVESGSFKFPKYDITLTSVLFCNTSFVSSQKNPIAWTEGCIGGLTSPGSTYLCRADSVQSIKGKLCSYTVGTWK